MASNVTNTPLVSVVTPVYNGEKFIRHAIESVQAQTYDRWEMIIYDDASNDNTFAIAKGYADRDSRIKIISGENRGGQSKARNAAIAAAQGAYIALLDADDIALPDRLKVQSSYMELHPDIAVAGSWTKIESANCDSYIYRSETDPEKVAAGLLFNTMLINSSVMMRKSFLVKNDVSYDPASAFLAEDYALWVKCAEKGRLVNIPKVLVVYKKHPDAISSERREELSLRAASVRERVLTRLGLHPDPQETQAHNNLKSPLGDQYAWLKKIQKANKNTHIYSTRALSETLENRLHDAAFANLNFRNSIFFLSHPFKTTPRHLYRGLKLLAKSLFE